MRDAVRMIGTTASKGALVALLTLCLLAAGPSMGAPKAEQIPGGALAAGGGKGAARAYSRGVTVNGRTFRVSVVEASLRAVRPKVGLARQRVGCTDSLAAIAQQAGALAAINGCYFDAYTPSPIKNPHHTLISDGEVLHLGGTVGSLLAFTRDGSAVIGRQSFRIDGSLDGNSRYPDNWYAYWVNRNPEAETTATIFTRDWARPTTPEGGTQIRVEHGVVTQVARSAQQIPADGFVLYLRGVEERQAARFRVGRRCAYALVPRGDSGEALEEIEEAIGCGPTLVRDGQVVVDPEAEGFRQAKVLTMGGARSAVGVTADGRLVLVACGEATMKQLASIMQALGCEQAMNLDGGASSGLWFEGKYLVKPGRALSNALLILPRR